MIIYKIVNKINNKSYIGQTIRDLDERVYWHIYSAKTGSTSFIHRAIKKYGIQSFEWSVLDIADSKEILNQKEIYWIKQSNSKIPNGYNMTEGGDGGATNKGKPHSEKTIKEMSEIKKGINNPFYGKKHSLETKTKMSKAQKGNQHLLGHKHSEEFKKNKSISWIGKNNPMKKPEIREKISLSAKARWNKIKRDKSVPENPKGELYV